MSDTLTNTETPSAGRHTPAEDGPNRYFCAFLNGWGHLKALNAYLDNSLLGDCIGAICLFATIYFMIFTAGVLL